MEQNIEINIEQLVLKGFSYSNRNRIAKALETELSQLLSEQGIPYKLNSGIELPRLDAGSINISPVSRAETIGVQLARTVYKGLAK